MNQFCIGHRGAKGHVPENTLASFEKAISLGCPWVELDVHLCEGELVVIHDESVERTTNGEGLVADLTLAELRALDAGDGQQVPTLREVLELVDRRAGVNVELKGHGTAATTNALLGEFVSKGWNTDEFLISSFEHDELALADSAYRRGVLFSKKRPDVIERALELKGWSVNVYKDHLTERLVQDAHAKGLHVLVYTVNSQKDIAHILGLGADGLFSDYPDRVMAALT